MKGSKLRIIAMFFAATLMMVACSKDDEKAVATGLDFSILNELKYWKQDSVKYFNDEVSLDTNVEDLFYKWDNNQLIFKDWTGYTDTIPYAININSISFNDDEKYWRISVVDLKREQLVLGFYRNDQADSRVAADSIYEYFSPVLKTDFDNAGMVD